MLKNISLISCFCLLVFLNVLAFSNTVFNITVSEEDEYDTYVFCCCRWGTEPDYFSKEKIYDWDVPPDNFCNGSGYQDNCCHFLDCASTIYPNRGVDGKCGGPAPNWWARCKDTQGQLHNVIECGNINPCRWENCLSAAKN